MRFPPCKCPRCRANKGAGDSESVVLRQLRARVTEVNSLRESMRRAE